MKVDLEKPEHTLKHILLRFKYVIGIFFIAVLALSFLMTAKHPQRLSYAKDYNYLYSYLDSLNEGKEVEIEKLEEKLHAFNGLRTNFNFHLINEYAKSHDFEKVESILSEVNAKSVSKNELVDKFTQASLNIERDELEVGYEKCMEIYKTEGIKESYPVLFAYNLFRLSELEVLLGKKEESEKALTELISYLKELESNPSVDERVRTILQNSVKQK